MKGSFFIGAIKHNDAIVTKIAKHGIYVSLRCDKPRACFGCSLCVSKQSKSGFFCNVSNPSGYREGQYVRIKYFSLHEAVASFVIFGIPIFCAIVAYAFCNIFFTAGIETSGLVITTTLAVVVGFFIVYIIERLIKYYYPVTIEKAICQNG